MPHHRHKNSRRHGRSSNQNKGLRRIQSKLNQSIQSHGPQGRLRGTPQQLADKYRSQAQDALSSGDQVLIQALFQHAEHYQRIVNKLMLELDEIKEEQRQQQEANEAAAAANEDQNSKSEESNTDETQAEASEDTEKSEKKPAVKRTRAPSKSKKIAITEGEEADTKTESASEEKEDKSILKKYSRKPKKAVAKDTSDQVESEDKKIATAS